MRTNGEKVTRYYGLEKLKDRQSSHWIQQGTQMGCGLALGHACEDRSAKCVSVLGSWSYNLLPLLCPSLQFQLSTFPCGIFKIKGKKKRNK